MALLLRYKNMFTIVLGNTTEFHQKQLSIQMALKKYKNWKHQVTKIEYK